MYCLCPLKVSPWHLWSRELYLKVSLVKKEIQGSLGCLHRFHGHTPLAACLSITKWSRGTHNIIRSPLKGDFQLHTSLFFLAVPESAYIYSIRTTGTYAGSKRHLWPIFLLFLKRERGISQNYCYAKCKQLLCIKGSMKSIWETLD